MLEIGAGSGQCSRWLAAHGATVVATDLSAGMVATGVAVNAALGDSPDAATRVPFAQCDGRALPFADASFDTVFTAYGVVPFVADSDVVMARGRPRAAPRRAVRLLDDPPGAVVLPRRPRGRRA